jgi:hypothetical protein
MTEQKTINEALIVMAHEYSVPTIAAVDSHYPCSDDRDTHQVWIAAQTNKDLKADGASLFTAEQDYHIKTRAEVLTDMGSYLPRGGRRSDRQHGRRRAALPCRHRRYRHRAGLLTGRGRAP